MPICVPAVLTRHRLSHPLIYPSAPHPGVERLLRQRVMRRPQQAVRRNASSHKPPPPLFSTRLEHPNSGMQNVVLWHVVLRACLFHTSLPLRPTAPPKRSSPRGREASASASHAAMHHAAGRQTHQRLPRTNLHHPSSLPCSSIQSLACKVFCYGMSVCVPAFQTRHRLSHTLLHPSAPHPGVEWLLHQRVMWPPIMQQVVRYKASSRTPPSPLFPTRLEHPESGMQNVLLWHDVLCACVFHTSPPQRPTAPPKRSSTRGREASSSARHAATHHVDGCQT